MLQKTLTLAFLLLSTSVSVQAQNRGSRTTTAAAPTGTFFITHPCANDSQCQSQCCGFKSGKCAGPVIAQERDGGCGFGDAKPNRIAADAFFSSQAVAQGKNPAGTTLKAMPTPPAAGNNNNNNNNNGAAGATPGSIKITSPCKSDADCESGCCGFRTGKCAGAIVALERDGGCGFGDAQSNDNAARKLRGQPPATPNNGGNANNNNNNNNNNNGTPKPPAAGNNAPITPGTLRIPSTCKSDADCESSCCGFRTGKCAGPIIAQERDGGCGFGDATPNDRAAVAFRQKNGGK